MKQKLLSLLVALVATITLWAYDCEVDGIYYNLNTTDLTAEVTRHKIILTNNKYSGSVIIPSSITCNSRTYSVTAIGEDAFYRCSGLTSVTIPNSVTTIGDWAFYYCTGLTSVTIPNSVTTIGDFAFQSCSGLTSVMIPNSVTTIGERAFQECSGLTSVTIGNSVTTIGDWAFYYCTGLTSINVDAANTHYCSVDGVLFDYAKETLIQYPASNMRTEYTIPNSVTTIGEGAFVVCKRLTSITIPNSVTTIGSYNFSSCSGLTSVTIPNSVTAIGDYAFKECSGLTSITIPNSVTTIGEYAFFDCFKLTSITIPNSVTTIGDGAFSYCIGLTSVTIPNSVTTIGEFAFRYCFGLTSINVDAANTHYCSVDGVLFNYAKETLIQYPASNMRTEYTIPNSVTTIGEGAFVVCKRLTSITIPNSVTTIGSYNFSSCSGLTSVTIPNSVTAIGDYAFKECSGLTSITIPNSVTTIGEYAFFDCFKLTSITIPNSVTTIGDGAFSYCFGLTSIKCFAVNPPTCGNNVFYYINQDAKVYVLASSLSAYQSADVWKDLNLLPLGADETPIEGNEPIVTPSDQDVTITWPITDGTDTYTLTITKNGEVVCVLTFNANGQLTNIAFAAPGHGNSHQAPAATLTSQGYQFTVIGLNPGTAYNYSVVATDAGGKTIAEHKGNFSTTGGTGFESVHGSQRTMHKYLHNGTLIINRNGQHYSAIGERVR